MRTDPVLEFEELRALLARFIRSPLGRAELDRLAPSSDRDAVQAALEETAEAIEYWRASAQVQAASRGAAVRPRFDFDADPAPIVARLRMEGATLEALEIFELARLLDLASEVRSLVLAASEKFPRLATRASAVADLREIASHLRGKIGPDGSLADGASPALSRMRRDSARQRALIEESLRRFLRAHREDGTLQEDFVAIRNDRFVVPVISGKERRAEGVIHGSSGSGHTVFVEPLETVPLNNELVQLQEEEWREIQRLLREFTARLREHAEAIAESVEALGHLELLFAQAEYAADFGCTVPRLSPAKDRRVILREARHPLLEDILRRQRKSVIPLSLSLIGDERTLLISGPNTGGKTVTLKTVGLAALMAHAGLPVPAAEAEFPLFDQVLADIGDHQSLQESLSSFSAHVLAIGSMLESATADSLVLLDELGSSTDPEEGGALGIVVLEAFRNRGAFALATTHLTPMKIYGASARGVRNGSMGFDEATLQPTYVLHLGAPGKSAGLDIAARLGLDPGLIQAARARMSGTERDVSRFLAELDSQLREIQDERDRLHAHEQAVADREASLEQIWERKFSAKIHDLEQRAAALAGQFEQRAEAVLAELKEQRPSPAPRKAQVKVAKATREYREAVESLAPREGGAAAERPKLVEGARVRLKGVRSPATVRRMISGDSLEVEAGFLKIRVPLSDVEEVLPPSVAPARRSGIQFHQAPHLETSWREINLIGQRAEEACGNVEKFLDTATLAQADKVRIVHGHGMGILKRAVAEVLKESPYVAKFYAAPPEEGGSGATIVELKGTE